jgi:hypothetical protein
MEDEPPSSIPSTILFDTARSTVFNVSLTASVAVFWRRAVVVKALTAGVKAPVLATESVRDVRKDILYM